MQFGVARSGVGSADDVPLLLVEVLGSTHFGECLFGASCGREHVCERVVGAGVEVDEVGSSRSFHSFARDLLGFGVVIPPGEQPCANASPCDLGVEVVLDRLFLYEIDDLGRLLVAVEQHERVRQERSEGGVVTVVADLQEGFGRGANDALRGGGIPGEKLDVGGLVADAGRGDLETELLRQRDC